MKIYVIEFDMRLVLPKLVNFNLDIFNYNSPIVFIEANNPDDACYLAHCKFAEVILKQDESMETATMIKDLFNDMRIKKVYCKDEA